MTAAEVLATIRRSHQGYPVLSEMVITDQAAVEAYSDANEAATAEAIATGNWEERARLLNEEYATPQTRRIDALLIGASGQRTAIEIKVSRADYRRETEEKRRAWRAITHRFVYCVPEGLIAPDEVPAGIGLWYAAADGIRTVRPCRINKDPLDPPIQLFNALCYRAAKAA